MLTSCVWIKKAVHVHDYVHVHVHVKVCGLCYRVGLAAKLNEMECDVIIDACACLLLIVDVVVDGIQFGHIVKPNADFLCLD
jgi:hypothetical protein